MKINLDKTMDAVNLEKTKEAQMSNKLRSIVYEHSSGHLVATAATEEQLGRIKDILCEPRTEACNATGRVPVEPEPQPAYAVGNWVEYFDNAELCHAQIDEIDSDYCTINPVVGWDRTLQRIRITCIARKIKPSEVVVHIGCLSGIVRSSYDSDGTLLTDEFILYRDDVKNAIIAKAMLDEPTHKLVNELLEKQEEGK